jgi:hypothetical protein
MLITSSFVNLFRMALLSWPQTLHVKPTHNNKPTNVTIRIPNILDANLMSFSVNLERYNSGALSADKNHFALPTSISQPPRISPPPHRRQPHRPSSLKPLTVVILKLPDEGS